jgi:NTE family protein
MAQRRLGLALGSGSARGLAHIGVLKVLDREGVRIDMIAGTSIGALIGGAYAAGITPHAMEQDAVSVDIKRLVSLADLARPTAALVNGRRVEDFIRTAVRGKTFAELGIPFSCVAVDVAGGREVVLYEGDLASAIRASLSTPVIFAPVERDGRLLVDGGVLNAVPVDVVGGMGADVVVAVTNLGIPRSKVPSFSNDKSEDSIATGKIKDAGFTQVVYSRVLTAVVDRLRSPSVYRLAVGSVELMQRELSEPRLRAADLVIAPVIDGAAYYSFYEAEKMIAAGERAAEAALDEIWGLLATGSDRPDEPTQARPTTDAGHVRQGEGTLCRTRC